jgi:pyridoxal 5'-phosphate synthase pdxS subunit
VVNYKDPKILAEISEDLGEPMVGIGLDELIENQKISGRGW